MSTVRHAVRGLALATVFAAATASAADSPPVDRSSPLHPKARVEPLPHPPGRPSNNGAAWTRTPDGRLLYRDGNTSVLVSGSVSATFAGGARH